MIDITPHKLRQAADIKERIDSLQNQLNELLGIDGHTPAVGADTSKKRKFGAAARAKMRKAQKARWAKIKGTTPEAKPVKKAKRKMSAAGRARIAAAARARWAKAKAQGKTRL